MSDDLIRDLQDLGADVMHTMPDPDDLRRVRRGITRRRRIRVAAAASLTAAAIAAVAVIAVPRNDHRAGITPTQPTVQVSTPGTVAVTTPAGTAVTTPPTTAPAPASTSPATAEPPTSAADVYVLMDDAGDVTVHSAVTGAVVRTVVTGSPATAGRDFAVVGPSGRYVYFVDDVGPARVPLTGGPLQRLPQPGISGGEVQAVYADATDTRVEETIGYADDSRPRNVVAMTVGSTAVTDLGAGDATGWSTDGVDAYVTTTKVVTPDTETQVASVDVTISPVNATTGVAAAGETYRSSSPGNDGACGPTSTATAIGPQGQTGWVLDGCSDQADGALNYTFRQNPQLSLASVTFPADDTDFYAQSVQYTPAGTAVFTLTHQDCGVGTAEGGTVTVVVRNEGNVTPVDLPGRDC